jgi:GlpG protein
MRQIATLPEDRARQFADYLLTLRIDTRLEPDPAGVAVWVCDEDKVSQARQELELFRRDPSDPRFGQAVGLAAALRRQETAEMARPQPASESTDEEEEPAGAERPVTIALIAICVVVALATNFGTEDPPTVLNMLRFAPDARAPSLDAITSGEVWRLVTPIFLHFGVLHLVFNALMLLALAGRVEMVRGPGRLLGLVVLFAVLSNLGEYFVGWSFTTGLTLGPKANFGGMSGVLYGLFGYMWMKGHFEPESGLGLPPDTVVILLGWFLLCLFGAFDTPTSKIANVAHSAGLLAGVAVGVAGSYRAWGARRGA